MENELPLAVRDSMLFDVNVQVIYMHDNGNVSKVCNDVHVNVIG